ncbi:MAG TPA: AraC family transcriptional regulator [Planctomycetota bacterium]|jgi:AraC-like DNA-binding protein
MRYFMRFLAGQQRRAAPQLLQVFHVGRRYELSILHATLEERRESGSAEHSHALYHAVLFTRGPGNFLLEGRTVRAQPGLLVLTSPGQPHDFGVHGAGRIHYRELTFELRDGEHVLRLPFHELLSLYMGVQLPRVAGPILLDGAASAALHESFQRLLARLTSTAEGGPCGAHVIVAGMFGLLSQALHGERVEQTESASPLDRARRMIEQRCMEPLELAQVASEAHLAPAYLCRAFKARFGHSPMAYYQLQRIHAAKSMLTNTSLSCKEVATRLGYADVFTFSKAFKRVAKSSPVRFREKAR